MFDDTQKKRVWCTARRLWANGRREMREAGAVGEEVAGPGTADSTSPPPSLHLHDVTTTRVWIAQMRHNHVTILLLLWGSRGMDIWQVLFDRYPSMDGFLSLSYRWNSIILLKSVESIQILSIFRHHSPSHAIYSTLPNRRHGPNNKNATIWFRN